MTMLRLPSIDDRCSAEWLAARKRQKLLLRCTCRATTLIHSLPALEDLLTLTFSSHAYAGMRILTGCSAGMETTTLESLDIACQ